MPWVLLIIAAVLAALAGKGLAAAVGYRVWRGVGARVHSTAAASAASAKGLVW